MCDEIPNICIDRRAISDDRGRDLFTCDQMDNVFENGRRKSRIPWAALHGSIRLQIFCWLLDACCTESGSQERAAVSIVEQILLDLLKVIQ